MTWNGIVDQCFNVMRSQVLLQLVALFALYDKKMVVMDIAGLYLGKGKPFLQTDRIAAGRISAALVPLLEVRELHP
jgi:hypothetical protein